MRRIGRQGRLARIATALFFIATLAAADAVVLGPDPVAAADTGDLDALKIHWQGRYRDLREKEARLVETVRLATKEYADSNRRNYRRSGVRHFHRTNANEAKNELADVRKQIDAMFAQVVAAGGSVNWLYEVDDEPRNPNAAGLGVYEDDGRFGGKGAYAPPKSDEQEGDERSDPAAPDGRNPIYYGEDDEPAEVEKEGKETFDYDEWRYNRDGYEQEHAPEKHLRPDDAQLDDWTPEAED